MKKIFITLLLFCSQFQVLAACKVSIEVMPNKAYSITLPGKDGVRDHFKLAGEPDFLCTIVIFKNAGSMLSCSSITIPGMFIQSDRSGITRDNGENNLSFRFKRQVYIKSTCD